MVHFPKYESYKDSGVEWLGEIPTNWNTRRIKSYALVKRGASPRPISDPRYFSDEGEYGWVRIEDVTKSNKYLLETKEYLSALGSSYSVKQHEGDLFLSIAGSVGKPIISKIKCCIHDGFVWFNWFNQVNREYLFYIFLSGLPFIGLGKHGTQLNLNTATIGDIRIPAPSLEEQKRIVEFLDRKTAEIDQAIAQKQRLIELLQEQKAILINQAVTKGLDPNVPMCDRGFEWIGEIPAHWSLMRFKHITSLLRDGTHLPPPRTEKGFRLLSVRNIVEDEFIFREDDSFISETHFKKLCKSFQPMKGDVLLAIVGATLGKVAVVPEIEPFCIQRSLAIFRPNEIVSSEYLKLWIQSSNIQNLLWNTTEFSAQPGIYLNSLKEFPIVLPSYKEQEKIVTKLFTQFEDVDRASQKTRSEIATLEELRQVFIAEAVTGKIKV